MPLLGTIIPLIEMSGQGIITIHIIRIGCIMPLLGIIEGMNTSLLVLIIG